MFRFLLQILIAASLVFIGSIGLAKDLTHRLGVGVKNNTAVDIPALAGVYYFQPDMAVTAGLGIDTEKNNSRFTFNGGLRRLIFKEDNLNFYFGGQAGLINYEVSGDKKNGFELSAIFGAEFFLAGLDSLAFTFEGGASILSASDVRFRTMADSPIRAGIIFYF